MTTYLSDGDPAGMVLAVLQAARDLVSTPGFGLSTIFGEAQGLPPEATARAVLQRRVAELDAALAKEAAPDPVGWEPRRWRELVAGDQVSMGGQEATIVSASTGRWSVDPRSNEYRPQPLKHDITHVRLEGRDPLYAMPSDGEVETLRGPAGQAVDEANGLRQGLDPVVVLESWAADAVSVLAGSGLDVTVMEVTR